MCLFYFIDVKLIMDKLNFVIEYLSDITSGLRMNREDVTAFANDMSRCIVSIVNRREVIEYLAREAQFRVNVHYDFYLLAGRILAKYQLEQIPSKFSEHVRLLYKNYRVVANDLNEHIPLIEKKYHDLVI